MADDVEPISVNLPWERVPVCACDKGVGPPPTKQQMMECKIRNGPCREGAEQETQPTGSV